MAAVASSIAIFIIMKNLKSNRVNGLHLANEQSWFLKKLFSSIHLIGITSGLLIYTGYMDIKHKALVEYVTVISTALFYWTFSIDFKKFKMDVEKV